MTERDRASFGGCASQPELSKNRAAEEPGTNTAKRVNGYFLVFSFLWFYGLQLSHFWQPKTGQKVGQLLYRAGINLRSKKAQAFQPSKTGWH